MAEKFHSSLLQTHLGFLLKESWTPEVGCFSGNRMNESHQFGAQTAFLIYGFLGWLCTTKLVDMGKYTNHRSLAVLMLSINLLVLTKNTAEVPSTKFISIPLISLFSSGLLSKVTAS